MTDFAIIQKEGFFDLNFNQAAADFDLDEGLEAAVIISAYGDARATVEQLPSGEIDQRGYWGDIVTEVEGDETGSLLWTLQREKALDTVVEKGKSYLRRALKWMIDDGVALRIEVDGFIELLSVQDKCLVLTAKIFRPQGDATFKFEVFWEAQEMKITRVA